MFFCNFHRRGTLEVEPGEVAPPVESATVKAVCLVFATVGLLASYVTWGFMQETVRM